MAASSFMGMNCRLPSLLELDHSFNERDIPGMMMMLLIVLCVVLNRYVLVLFYIPCGGFHQCLMGLQESLMC